jgi:hypothetical protein
MADYSSQWHQYRVLNRLGFVAFAAFLSALPISIAAERWGLLAPVRAKSIFIRLGVVALVSLWVVMILIAFWRCPRCHDWYGRRRLVGWNSFKRECVHCGLRLYEGEATPEHNRLRAP